MRILATILLLSGLPIAYSQGLDRQSTMFWNNLSTFNPAATGLHQRQGTVSYRYHSGNDKTLAAGYNMKVHKLHGSLGLNYMLDEQGFTKQNKVDLNYSYHFYVGRGILSAGISAGIIHLNERQFFGSISGINVLPETVNGTAFSSNAGVTYSNRRLIVGLSTTQFNNPRFEGAMNAPQRNYHLNAGYAFIITRNFTLKPQVLLTTNLDYTSVNLNVLAYYKRWWLGTSYRLHENVSFMAGYDIRRRFRVGYNYDLNQSKLNSTYTSTHEFVFSYIVPKRSCKPIFHNHAF